MDFEHDDEDHRRMYRLSRVGFALLAASLIVGSLCSIAALLLIFSGQRPDLGRLLGIERFDFQVATLRAGLRVAGAFFLWSAWAEPGWRRRAGLLVMMAVGDLILWSAEYSVLLGLTEEPLSRHEVFRHNLAMALSWAKLALIAGLSGDFLRAQGQAPAADFARAARATATTGAGLWFVFFLRRVNWDQPWPLAERPMTGEMLLFLLTIWAISAVCLVQTSILTMIANRAAGQTLRTLAEKERGPDPWA